MSPSEFDLRAALQSGADDAHLDVDRVVAVGSAARARRRTRLATAAASVVLVAALGTVGGIALTGDDSGGRHDSAQSAPRGRASEFGAGGGAAAASTNASSAPLVGGAPGQKSANTPEPASRGSGAGQCPQTYPRLALAGGGGSGQFGASGPLFPRPVGSLVICAYGSVLTASTGGGAGRAVLPAATAEQLRASLESASTTRKPIPCPAVRPADRRAFAFVAVGTDGVPMRPVTVTLSSALCDTVVTNGTAVRYDWTPPAAVADLLASVPQGAPPTASLPRVVPSGKNHGSPVR